MFKYQIIEIMSPNIILNSEEIHGFTFILKNFCRNWGKYKNLPTQIGIKIHEQKEESI